GPHVDGGVAAMTVVYESLTTMTAGALLASVFFSLQAWDIQHTGWKALLLLAGFSLLIIPGIFNRLIAILARPFPIDQTTNPTMPPVHWRTLASGILLAGCGWGLQGAGLWAVLQAVLSNPPAWSWNLWEQYTASLALANVAGFLVIFVPYGLGVREILLQATLA